MVSLKCDILVLFSLIIGVTKCALQPNIVLIIGDDMVRITIVTMDMLTNVNSIDGRRPEERSNKLIFVISCLL